MPTNPYHGFFLVPVGILDDEDFQSLSSWERGVWFTILARCYNNHLPWSHNGEEMPAYSMVCTAKTLSRLAGHDEKNAERDTRRLVNKLGTIGWVKLHIKRRIGTRITLTNAERWQSFETYRRTFREQSVNNERTIPVAVTAPTPTPTPTPTTKKKSASLFQQQTPTTTDRAIEVADAHRRYILGHPEATTAGIKTDRGWAKKRAKAAAEYRGLALDGVDYDRQLALLEFAFVVDESSWGDGVRWRDVLSRGAPWAAFCRNAKTIGVQLDKHERARQREEQPYTHATMITAESLRRENEEARRAEKARLRELSKRDLPPPPPGKEF